MMKYIVIFFTAVFISFNISAQSKQIEDTVTVERVEGDGNIIYPKRSLVNPDFDFKLKKTGTGKFLLTFYKNEKKSITIKVYDLIGNLIIQETINKNGAFSKEYDLSYYRPRFFVVEAGSSQYNKTKSIIVE